MASIYLIRHGQASFGKENYDQLSELGEKQATILGQSLSQRIDNFDQVYLGSMLRHKQTAVNCLGNFENKLESLDTVYDTAWNEYDHYEILFKLHPELNSMRELMALMEKKANPKEAFRSYFSDAIARWMSGDYDADYGETWNGFTQRVHGALQRVVDQRSSAKNIVVFTSGGPISVLTQALLGVPKEQVMKMNWTLLNCGVTKLVATSSRLFVASLNEHTHFEGQSNKHLITYT